MVTNSQSLLSGDYWHNGTGSISYSFLGSTPPSYYEEVDIDSDPQNDAWEIPSDTYLPFGTSPEMTAAEKALSELAVERWNEVANLNITEATGGVGDITFASFGMNEGTSNTPDEYLFGFAYYPGTPGSPDVTGDVWINRNNPYQATTIEGHTSWLTYLHELGHALGLTHPNNDPNNNAGDPTNNNQYTVMSYLEHPSVSSMSYDDQPWPLTPMIYDIEAIQQIYGVNTATRAGNTAYFGDGAGGPGSIGETAFQYGGDDMKLFGRTVILTIWDAGGADDVLDVSEVTTAATINLEPGTFSTIGDIADNVALASAVEIGGQVINYIENVIGTLLDDRVDGNAADNELLGKTGHDTMDGAGGDDEIHGQRGNDWIYGGTGRDILVGGFGDDVLIGNYDKDQLFGGVGNDVLKGRHGTDYLVGDVGNDTIEGGSGADLIEGNAGKDSILGGTGDDTVLGGAGTDVVSGDAGSDLVMGGGGADLLYGGDGYDELIGGDGGDTLIGGGEGDVLTGGSGADHFVFNSLADSQIGPGEDLVTDFEVGVDKIDLSTLAPGLTVAIGGGLTGTGPSARTAEAGGHTAIYIDFDGDGGSDMRITLGNVTGVTEGDFIL